MEIYRYRNSRLEPYLLKMTAFDNGPTGSLANAPNRNARVTILRKLARKQAGCGIGRSVGLVAVDISILARHESDENSQYLRR
jgi:hypothetical protein